MIRFIFLTRKDFPKLALEFYNPLQGEVPGAYTGGHHAGANQKEFTSSSHVELSNGFPKTHIVHNTFRKTYELMA